MSTSSPRTAARLLVDCLAAEGCEWVFSVPGEETMDVLDALADDTRVQAADAIPQIVAKAFRVAQLAKPGPTHIELPEDVAASLVGPELVPLPPSRAYFPEPTDEAIAHAASLIASSSRPI